jgi:SAM-dependent methyltransferase
MASTFNARDAAAYERSMGRWSRRLAPLFIDFACVAPGDRIVDVGCGTGSLTHTLAAMPIAGIEAIDASEIYVAALAQSLSDPRIHVRHGDACALPFADGQFDRALCQLVLQFIPDPDGALAEMRRVVRPGGLVAAAVWCSGGGMPHQRLFWDTAALLDPEARASRAKTFSRRGTNRGELRATFEAAGLVAVEESHATIWMEYADFEDYWGPIIGGEGTLGRYASGLSPAAAATLAGHLRDGFLAGGLDGPRAFACTALICRGVVR